MTNGVVESIVFRPVKVGRNSRRFLSKKAFQLYSMNDHMGNIAVFMDLLKL
jgi:hypothetical protein